MLERREQVVQVERAGLRPGLRADDERELALSGACQSGAPFAVATVEHQHRIAGRHPQHVAEVVRLRRIERDARPLFERRIDVQARRAEIVAGHRCRVLSGWALVAPDSAGPLYIRQRIDRDDAPPGFSAAARARRHAAVAGRGAVRRHAGYAWRSGDGAVRGRSGRAAPGLSAALEPSGRDPEARPGAAGRRPEEGEPEELCKLFQVYLAAESKMVKGLEESDASCGVPADVPKQVKAQHPRPRKWARISARWRRKGRSGRCGSIGRAGPTRFDAPVPQCTEKTLMPGVPCVD